MEENNINEQYLKDFPPYEVEELTKEEILGDTVINYLLSLQDESDRAIALERVKDKARELKVLSSFNNLFKKKDKKMQTTLGFR